ncbi:hypothetical protein CEXT_285561 [Caerostris extrusa]|uniref:Uncharacterized protein n=1 Tax=Caerostris extrusa TaxID=172846 RepID=A0AAV4Y3A5_CAEEX|nr:hypothetical protein CEXT_285561 [Caerostris extrusa]
MRAKWRPQAASVPHAPAITVAVPLWSKVLFAQQFAINRLLRSGGFLWEGTRKANVPSDNEEDTFNERTQLSVNLFSRELKPEMELRNENSLVFN